MEVRKADLLQTNFVKAILKINLQIGPHSHPKPSQGSTNRFSLCVTKEEQTYKISFLGYIIPNMTKRTDLAKYWEWGYGSEIGVDVDKNLASNIASK